LSDRLEGARDQPNSAAKTRRSHGGFRSGVAGTDDEDIEIQFGTHERRIAELIAECGLRIGD
jgi:hypothetical protein